MKAHKLNLKNYKVDRVRIVKGQEEKSVEDYEIKEIIVNIMLHPSLKHKGFRFYTVEKVAKKIANSKNDIVLDKADFEIVKECFDTFEGFSKNDAEMVRRIYDAEEIEVEEKKKKK